MKATRTLNSTRTESLPWVLKLFVAQNSVASQRAIVQVRRLVAEYLPKGSILEIIDVHGEIDAAVQEQVLAIPTLIRTKPEPVRRIIGDLSKDQRLLTLLGVKMEN